MSFEIDVVVPNKIGACELLFYDLAQDTQFLKLHLQSQRGCFSVEKKRSKWLNSTYWETKSVIATKSPHGEIS